MLLLIAIGGALVTLGIFGVADQLRRYNDATFELVLGFCCSVGTGLALVLHGCGVG